MIDAVKVKNDCVQWIRDWFAKNGPDCNAVIGISGGKDSSVAAALCVEALGKDRVYGILMPNGMQEDIDDSLSLCDHLGIKRKIINIQRIVDACYEGVYWTTHELIKNYAGYTEQTKINVPPRIRMTMLYAFSQSANGRVCCTDNASEAYIGYSTRWGDNVGDFSPLVNLLSDEVVALGDALGLPYELTHKTPSDGLCGKTDEDSFGFTYKQLNDYIRFGSCGDREIGQKIAKKHFDNMFKLEPIPSFKPFQS